MDEKTKISVLSTKEIMHPNGTQGPRIGKVQQVEIESEGIKNIIEIKFWYQWETGELLRVL